MAYPKQRAVDLIKAGLEQDSPCYGMDEEVYRALKAELGGPEAAMTWLRAVMGVTQKVMLITSDLPNGGKQSIVVPPPDWDEERVRSEIARLWPVLESIGPLEAMTVKRGTWQG
jgi:hypothetical protein